MNSILRALTITGAILLSFSAGAQYRTDLSPEEAATAQKTFPCRLPTRKSAGRNMPARGPMLLSSRRSAAPDPISALSRNR